MSSNNPPLEHLNLTFRPCYRVTRESQNQVEHVDPENSDQNPLPTTCPPSLDLDFLERRHTCIHYQQLQLTLYSARLIINVLYNYSTYRRKIRTFV